MQKGYVCGGPGGGGAGSSCILSVTDIKSYISTELKTTTTTTTTTNNNNNNREFIERFRELKVLYNLKKNIIMVNAQKVEIPIIIQLIHNYI